MRLKSIVLFVVAFVTVAGSVQAADTKVGGRMYGTWMYDLSDGADGANEFSLDRTYLDVKSSLSEWTSARLTSDLKETDIDGKTRYEVIIKYGFFDWKPQFAQKRLTVRFGLQPTMYIDNQNGMWGRRYLSKTVGDLNKFLTTSDLGASAIVGLGKKGELGSITLGVFNGTSYSDLGEANKQKDVNGVVMLKPLTSNPDFSRTTLTGQFYHGVQNMPIPDSISGSDWKRQIASMGGLLAYRHTVDVGVDLNFATMGNGAGAAETKSTGHSFFGTLYFQDMVAEDSPLRTLNIFGRVDLLDPNTDVENDASTLLIAGVECAPTKGFKASVNYRADKPEDDALQTTKGLYVNTLFKF